MTISDVFRMIISVYNDWGRFLINPRYCRSDHVVTWHGRTSHFMKGLIQQDDIRSLIESGQYSFLTADDGSVIQLHYEFERDGTSIQSASLAYYAASAPYNDSGMSFGEESGPELDTPTSYHATWLRIDYGPATARGVLHHECHLHISGFPYSRLMVRRLPTPKQFVEFIVAICHPNEYMQHRLNPDGNYADPERIARINDMVFSCEDNDLYSQMMHLTTPEALP